MKDLRSDGEFGVAIVEIEKVNAMCRAYLGCVKVSKSKDEAGRELGEDD